MRSHSGPGVRPEMVNDTDWVLFNKVVRFVGTKIDFLFQGWTDSTPSNLLYDILLFVNKSSCGPRLFLR